MLPSPCSVSLSLPKMSALFCSDTGHPGFKPVHWAKRSLAPGEENLTHEQGNMSIPFEGQSSSGIKLCAPLWNTSQKYSGVGNHFLPRARGDGVFGRSAVTPSWPGSLLTLRCFFTLFLEQAAQWFPDWLWSWSMAGSGWTPVPILDL